MLGTIGSPDLDQRVTYAWQRDLGMIQGWKSSASHHDDGASKPVTVTWHEASESLICTSLPFAFKGWESQWHIISMILTRCSYHHLLANILQVFIAIHTYAAPPIQAELWLRSDFAALPHERCTSSWDQGSQLTVPSIRSPVSFCKGNTPLPDMIGFRIS